MPKKTLTSKIIKLILAIAICLLLIFLNPRNFFNPVRGTFLKISYPFQKTFYLAGQKTHNFFSLLFSIGDYKKNNEKLIKENNELSAKLADAQDQKRENEELRKQLELSPRGKYNLEPSLVIAQDPRGSGSWIVIDKGKADGIAEGMPVIVFDGILVGKISEVYSNSSKVFLLSDSGSSTNVSDVETSAKGILTGEYGLGLKLGMVEQTDIIKSGDDIVTSGLGGLMPKGLLVGKIDQVSNSSDKLFQEAVVRPKVKYSDLNVVFAIKGVK
ncbi:MAG TPA: rod shape-determining protein MreC [Candidatus Moranbacteria bacterium]|nr:rod shape-determining protein MreC [Candidatus Moranbacteria bacterium]